LCQDYERFRAMGAEVIAIGPDTPERFRRYWAEHRLPFIGLADPEHRVAGRYGQEVKLLKLGRLPAVVVVDREGIVRAVHYGDSMRDIPPNETLLATLAALDASAGQSTAGAQPERKHVEERRR
jgi:peroxiredoxin Q/BCP